jgi:hypothetical protein
MVPRGPFRSFSVLIRELRSRMPKDAFTLSDVCEPTLTIVAGPCGRRGRYSVGRLIETHGDARLTDLRMMRADCPKAQSASIWDRRKVRYEGLTTR